MHSTSEVSALSPRFSDLGETIVSLIETLYATGVSRSVFVDQ